MTDINVRYLKFDVPDEIDPMVLPGEPEMSYLLVGLSMILPYLEPYLIKNNRLAQKKVTDPELLHDMKQFCRQECQHHQQHNLVNEKVRKLYPGLAELEKEVAEDYARFTAKGLKFNVAFGEGFESLTFPVVVFMYETGMMQDMTNPLGDIYTWHFCEEVEHRNVLYDAYYELYSDYFFRLKVSLISQFHLLQFMVRCAQVMLRQDGKEAFVKYGGWPGRMKRLWRWTKLAIKHLLPNLKQTYLPQYSPHDIPVSPAVQTLTDSYTERAFKVS
ncbi:MAG: metal-dependent hydrolase [Cyanobacteria bacterium P01_G01_bin.54]